ncbi:MAG: DUF2490 domain-containing protein [Prevotella sp.]|nr:DUF2490 domain-containing protein [Prevotella sp.]
MEKRVIILAAVGMMACGGLRAQSDEFGIWTELSVEKKFSKTLSAAVSVENRTRNNLQNVDRWSGAVSVDYKIAKWLKAGVGYSYLYDYNPEQYTFRVKNGETQLNKRTMTYFGSRHRFSVSLTASHDFAFVTASLRERWQYTYRPSVADKRMDYQHEDLGYSYPVKGKGKNVWRNRLQLKYKTKDMLRPYVSVESYVARGLDKMRYSAGTEIKLSKQHSLDAAYLFQKTYDDDWNEGNRHIIALGYTCKF